MLRITSLVSFILSIIACSNLSTRSDVSLKEYYLEEAKRKIPELDKHSYQLVLGELNDDGVKDAAIAYAYGEGMRPIGKKLVLLLSSDKSGISIRPYQSDYCLKIDTIMDATLRLTELSDCITGKGTPISKRRLIINADAIEEEIIWRLKDDFIHALKVLQEDLVNAKNTELRKKYNFDFSKFDSSMKQERSTIKDILRYNQLDQLKEEEMISFIIEEETTLLTYEIKQITEQLQLIVWTKHIENPAMGESVVHYHFTIREGQLQFLDMVRAG